MVTKRELNQNTAAVLREVTAAEDVIVLSWVAMVRIEESR